MSVKVASMRLLIALILGGLSPLYAQENSQRDLLEKFELDAAPEVFSIEFELGEHPDKELTVEGQRQLEEANVSLRPKCGGFQAYIVEAWACTLSSGGADYPSTLRRGIFVKEYLLNHQALSATQLYLLVHGKAKAEAGTGESDQHAKHGQVLIRPWGEEQMAELTDELVPPPPNAKVSFWYKAKGAGKFEPLPAGFTLSSGDEFQIEISAAQPAYVYIFHRGSGGNWECLYPRIQAEGNPGSRPLEPGKEYWLPRSGKGYILDDTPGKEETCVYLGANPSPLLERWVVEGVPWQVSPSTTKERGIDKTVRVESPISHINWYRRFPFDHRPETE